MPRRKSQSRPVPPLSTSAFEQAWSSVRAPQSPPPTISGRWLLTAAGLAIVAAAACAWLALCLLFWQGSWQLLYHPTALVTRTPASVGVAFDAVGFATTEAGELRLKGWWIPAAPGSRYGRYTVLYLHGQSGNLGDTVDSLAALHAVGTNILAFDYRGYGQSQFAHPSEQRWREDAESALQYLTATRHVPADSLILDGSALGANLALEVAAAHPELAGVVLESPLESPVNDLFADPRARLVPARLLVRDRFDANAAAAALRIPSAWFLRALPATTGDSSETPEAWQRLTSRKMVFWVVSSPDQQSKFADSIRRWLDDLPAKPGNP
jgi:pimeloyl-ACP methyl ester carboxylesterase